MKHKDTPIGGVALDHMMCLHHAVIDKDIGTCVTITYDMGLTCCIKVWYAERLKPSIVEISDLSLCKSSNFTTKYNTYKYSIIYVSATCYGL